MVSRPRYDDAAGRGRRSRRGPLGAATPGADADDDVVARQGERPVVRRGKRSASRPPGPHVDGSQRHDEGGAAGAELDAPDRIGVARGRFGLGRGGSAGALAGAAGIRMADGRGILRRAGFGGRPLAWSRAARPGLDAAKPGAGFTTLRPGRAGTGPGSARASRTGRPSPRSTGASARSRFPGGAGRWRSAGPREAAGRGGRGGRAERQRGGASVRRSRPPGRGRHAALSGSRRRRRASSASVSWAKT